MKFSFREVVLGDRYETGYVAPRIDTVDGFLRTCGLSGLLFFNQHSPVRGLLYDETPVGFLLDGVPRTRADEKLAGNLSTLFSRLRAKVGRQCPSRAIGDAADPIGSFVN